MSVADPGAVRDAFSEISERVSPEWTERDVENVFIESGFYQALGYEGTGVDVRSEFTLPDNRRPDYITLSENESVTAVYEFKTSGRDLGEHEPQLFHYMDALQAEYGVLTNGDELRLYSSGGG